jgi:hypothetical protein
VRSLLNRLECASEVALVSHPKQDAPSIVDVLMGRHHHAALMKVSPQQRVYHNYRMHDASLRAEIATAGRHRNRDLFVAGTGNDIGDTVRRRRL